MGSDYADTKKKTQSFHLCYLSWGPYLEFIVNRGSVYWQHTIQLASCVAFLTFFSLKKFSVNQTFFCTLLFALINKDMFLIAGNISFFCVITIHTTMLWCTREPLELSSLVMEHMYTDVLEIPQGTVKLFKLLPHDLSLPTL